MGWIITKADRPDDARCKSCGYEFRHGDPIAILDDEVALDEVFESFLCPLCAPQDLAVRMIVA